ncbi:MAG: hypothetical protein ICV63_03395 [Coleofasciculus sp. Co-bin14]|nr:hypothetical protein [Coleofasciculus sp. Co-bin14]
MLQNNGTLNKKEEPTCLSSLAREVDNIFFSLRKTDQIIRRELNLLNQGKYYLIKKVGIEPLNADNLKFIIDKLPSQHLLLDEYIIYMLKNENNSIFKLIATYNEHLQKRTNEQENNSPEQLKIVDEKLAYYIRNLGAMIYHLNIHLNLLNVLLKNASVMAGTQQNATRGVKEIMTKYMVNEWGGQLRDVRFLEITIDEPYALVTWALEDIKGDAILLQEAGYWQLMNIRAGKLGLKDFENADIPVEIAQRMLRLHNQKLGY